jgi:histidine triad (HIT) family protein
MPSDDSCIFCRIVAGQEAASLVYRDDLVTAFMDILPVNIGHLLVVPNQHSADLAGLDGSGARMHSQRLRPRRSGAVRGNLSGDGGLRARMFSISTVRAAAV